MTFFPLGAFLLIGAATIVVGDPLHVNMVFTCTAEGASIGKWWCGNLTVYEHDPVSAHDMLTTAQFCEHEEVKVFNFTFNPNGDRTPNYEVNYQLQHDCTWDSSVKCLNPYNYKEVPADSEQTVSFEQETFHVGEAGPCKPLK